MMNRAPASRVVGAVCLSLVLAGAAGVAARQQASAPQASTAQPSPALQRSQPSFRSGVTLVPVDVRVIDRNGKPVTDLRQDEFIVTEDGVRQTISHFAMQRFEALTVEPGAKPALRTRATPTISEQSGRVFLILLGRGRLQYPSNGLNGVIHLVKDRLLPQDQVAVMAWNRATDFTNDHAKIIAVLERFKRQHELIEELLVSRVSGLAAVYGSREIPKEVQKTIDAVFHGAGTATSRRILPSDVPGGDAFQKNTDKANENAQTAALMADPERPMNVAESFDSAMAENQPLGFDEFVTQQAQVSQDMQNLSAGIEYMRLLQGEKHLVFVSEQGLYLPDAADNAGVLARANQARVVIDTIQTGGVQGPPTTAPTAASGLGGGRSVAGVPSAAFNTMNTFGIGALRGMSGATGGVSSAYQDAARAVDRIDATTRFSYLIGYRPTNNVVDARYRRIAVRVTRPGLTVLYRHGYYSNEAPPPLDRRASLTHQRIASAGYYAKPLTDIPVTVSVNAVMLGAARSDVTLDARIDLSRVAFAAEGDQHVASIDVAIFAADKDERLVGQSWNKVDLKMGHATFQEAIRKGLPFTVKLSVVAQPRWVKVIVYNYDADLVGSTVLKLK